MYDYEKQIITVFMDEIFYADTVEKLVEQLKSHRGNPVALTPAELNMAKRCAVFTDYLRAMDVNVIGRTFKEVFILCEMRDFTTKMIVDSYSVPRNQLPRITGVSKIPAPE